MCSSATIVVVKGETHVQRLRENHNKNEPTNEAHLPHTKKCITVVIPTVGYTSCIVVTRFYTRIKGSPQRRNFPGGYYYARMRLYSK